MMKVSHMFASGPVVRRSIRPLAGSAAAGDEGVDVALCAARAMAVLYPD
jgi:hypothetical protein